MGLTGMTMNLFHNMTITLQYQVVKKLTENLDERMRYQILLNLHYSNLLKEKWSISAFLRIPGHHSLNSRVYGNVQLKMFLKLIMHPE